MDRSEQQTVIAPLFAKIVAFECQTWLCYGTKWLHHFASTAAPDYGNYYDNRGIDRW